MGAPRGKQFSISGLDIGGGTGSPTVSGQISWATGFGSIVHISGPSDFDLTLRAANSRKLWLGAGSDRWVIDASGHFGGASNNLYDIGVSGGYPRSIYAGTSVIVGGTITIGPSSINTTGALTIGASATAIEIGASGKTTTIKGDLVVDGTTTSVNSEVLLADHHLYMNAGYTTTSAQKGGLTVNYLPTSVATTGATGGFADANTVNVASTTGFAVGMFIQMSGADNVENEGVYEIEAIGAGTPGTLDIAASPTHDFCLTGFTTDATDTGVVVTNVTVSTLQCKTNGVWQQGQGATAADLTASFASLGGVGTATGETSVRAATVDAISGVTQATSTTVSSFNVRSHPDGSETGQQFEFKVPDDYDSGDIEINITYRMSTSLASPNNQVRLETAAEIAPAAGGLIDAATYGLTQSNLTTLEDQDWSRATAILTLSEGDFAAADSILVKVKRRGDDGGTNDKHTGAFQIMTYDFAYTSQIATREVTQNITLFDASDETASTPSTKSSFNTMDYSGSAINEQQFQIIVPDNWDGASDLHIQATYAMGAAESSKTVFLRTEYEVADVSGGSISTSGTEDHTEYPPNDTNVRRTVSLRGIPAADIGAGDSVLVKLKRLGSTDTHTSTFKLIAVSVYTGVAPKTGFNAVTVTQDYLECPVFDPVSASGVSGDLEYPTFSGDFETWAFMSSTTSTGRIDVCFSGRLSDSQTTISEIKIPIIGDTTNSQYQIKVFVEGSGASNVFTASALTAASTTRAVTTILAAGLSAQPSGEKRYHVVVEATLDNTEELRVGMPFVKQE